MANGLFGTKKIKGIKEAGLGLIPKNTDESTNQSSESTKEDFFEDEDEISKYEHAYRNCANVGTSIDIQSEQAVQDFYFEGPQEKELEEWADEVNLGLWINKVSKRMLKHGKCYGELVALNKIDKYKDFKSKLSNPLDPNKILPTKTMGMIKTVTSLDPSHFLQRTSIDKKIYWGGSAPEKYPQAKKAGKLEDIYYFEWNEGLSIIHSSLLLVQIKDQMESDMPTIVKRYVAPIIDLSVGDENNQPDEDDIDNVKKDVEDIYADTEFVHSYLVKSQVLGFQGKMVDTSHLFEHTDTNIEKGVQTPLDLFLGVGATDKGADTKLRGFGRHIKHIQRVMKANIEDGIIARMTGNRKNKIIWGFAEEREKEMEIDIVRGLKTDGIISPQKANDLLPKKFKEDLPENLKDPMKAAMANANGDPQNKGADGMKDRHNKTDPTKSTTVEPGKRVDKKDKSVVLKRSA